MNLFVGDRCRIVVGEGCASRLSKQPRGLGDYDRVVCLYDPNVAAHAGTVATLFGTAELVPVPGGEHQKNLHTAEQLCHELRRRRCTRGSLIVNVGGGVVTDVGGFVSSIYMRGIDFVNVPTTLLGMCDAAIGGKTGVDLGTFKNLVGAFRQPRLVLIDPLLLHTLPAAQMREGLVEVVKMAAVLDAQVLQWLEENVGRVLAKEPEALLHCVQEAVRMKVEVVQADAHEAGRRMLLNFGHTVGHALEAISDFEISHGQAVSLGMVWEMRMAGSEGVDRIVALLRALDMPVELNTGMNLDDLWEAMRSDKKNVGDVVRMAVPRELGEGRVLEVRREQLCA